MKFKVPSKRDAIDIDRFWYLVVVIVVSGGCSFHCLETRFPTNFITINYSV